MKFQDMPYSRPNLDELLAEYRQLTEKVATADAASILELYETHCNTRSSVFYRTEFGFHSPHLQYRRQIL